MSLASLGGGSPAPLPPALKLGRAQDAADPCSGDDPTTTVSSDSSSPRTRVRGLTPAPLSLTLQRKLPCPFLPLPAADHAHFSAPPPMAPPVRHPTVVCQHGLPRAGPLTPRRGADTRSASLPSLCRGLRPSTQQVCAGSWGCRALQRQRSWAWRDLEAGGLWRLHLDT